LRCKSRLFSITHKHFLPLFLQKICYSLNYNMIHNRAESSFRRAEKSSLDITKPLKTKKITIFIPAFQKIPIFARL
jgi:hypothetical protein